MYVDNKSNLSSSVLPVAEVSALAVEVHHKAVVMGYVPKNGLGNPRSSIPTDTVVIIQIYGL